MESKNGTKDMRGLCGKNCKTLKTLKNLNLQHMWCSRIGTPNNLNISFPSKFSAILIKIPVGFFFISLELEKLIQNVMWECTGLVCWLDTLETEKTMVHIHKENLKRTKAGREGFVFSLTDGINAPKKKVT